MSGGRGGRGGRIKWCSSIIAVVVAAGACGTGDGGGDGRPAAAVNPFAALPADERAAVRPFDVERLGGGRLRLADYRGRIVLLNVWASWCGPCRAEMPALDALARELEDSAFAFITISEDVERERAAAFVAELGFQYPVGFGDGRLRGRYYGFGLPATILIDTAGRAMYRWAGYGGAMQLDAIRAMVRAERREPPPPEPAIRP